MSPISIPNLSSAYRVWEIMFCNILLVLTLLFSQGASARTLFKRDAPLTTVNIPLTVNKDKRYVVGVNMSSSPEQQSFKFALAANTGYSAVAGIACDSCDGVPSYNASASGSEMSFPGSMNVSIGAASISGPFIKENCSLHEANGTQWQYPNQTIIVANSSSSIFSDVTSGLIGLGTNANGASGDFFDTVYGQWLIHNPSRDNFTFGMALQPPTFTSDNDQGNGGVLHWTVPDPSAFEGAISWSTANVSSAIANSPTSSQNTSDTSANTGLELPESDWSIEMDGWAASISGTAVGKSNKTMAIVEPFFSDIFFPSSQANLFYSVIPSAVKLNTLVDEGQAWSLPCDTALSVAFTFSGQSFPLDETQLIVKQSDGTCIGTIKAWPTPLVNSFLFGSNFISAFYLIFVVGRPGSDIPNSIGMATRRKSSSSKPIGAIVGGTVGGVIFVALLVVAAYTLGRRRPRRQASAPQDSSPPTTGEKDKFFPDHKPTGSTDDGQQYAINTLPLYGQYGHKQLPTPPSTAHSAQPFLPEAHSPQSPAFSVPNTPESPKNFITMASTPSSHRSHFGEVSTASVSSRISYNPNALGANMSATRAHNPHSVHDAADVNRRDVTIEPFILPNAPLTSASHGHKFIPSDSGAPLGQSYNEQQTNDSDAPTSPQDLDPLSPSTSSAGATIVPFVLPPPPRGAMTRNIKKGSLSSHLPRRVTDPPAPPYSAQATGPVSPTLVEFSQGSP